MKIVVKECIDDKIFKDFFKIYYRQKLRTAKIIMTAIAVVLLCAALKALYSGDMLITVLCLWIALFLAVYPNIAYKKPYKAVRKTTINTRFCFEDNIVTEKSHGEEKVYSYSEIKKVIETGRYFLLMYTENSATIFRKYSVKADELERLTAHLKAKCDYKKIKY